MFFTQEDYKKIQSWLQQNAIKDTEFKDGLSTLTGSEIITIVQNGCNVKLYLKDFIEQIILLGLPDFVNITVKFHKKNISLEEAISLIPCLSRKIGQVITFINEQGEWKIYQFQGGDITQWNNLTLWVGLLKQMIGTVSWDDIEGKPEFAIVAASGDYNDLENKPDIPEPHELPIASNTTLGEVKVDGDSITIGLDGTITAHAEAEPTSDYKKLTNDGRGTTEQRPSGLMASNAGYRYYDSTIEQTIVWNGEEWCNEDMTLLSKVVII